MTVKQSCPARIEEWIDFESALANTFDIAVNRECPKSRQPCARSASGAPSSVVNSSQCFTPFRNNRAGFPDTIALAVSLWSRCFLTHDGVFAESLIGETDHCRAAGTPLLTKVRFASQFYSV
jgi:hypothetical protein